MRKKRWLAALTALLCLAFTACAVKAPPAAEEEKMPSLTVSSATAAEIVPGGSYTLRY